MSVTAVKDRLTLTREELIRHLKLDIDSDDTDALADMDALLSDGKEAADDYLQNPFLADDGTTELPIPRAVRRWVLGYCAMLHNNPELGVQQESINGMGTRIYQLPGTGNCGPYEIYRPIAHLRVNFPGQTEPKQPPDWQLGPPIGGPW